MKKRLGLVLGCAGVVIAVSVACLQSPTSSTDHIYEGKQLMADQKYWEAEAEFALAIEANPRSADARYWHAKAVWKAQGPDFNSLLELMTTMEELQGSDSSGTLFDMALFTGSSYDAMNDMYKATRIIKADLKEIYEGRATQGFMQKEFILDDYSMVTMVQTTMSFLDLFPPYGELDRLEDNPLLNIAISPDSINLDNLDSLAQSLAGDPEQVQQLLTVVENLDDSKDIIFEMVGGDASDTSALAEFNVVFDSLSADLDSMIYALPDSVRPVDYGGML